MDIGEKIKRLRIEKQLTQEELANRCELSKGFISQLENNLTSPSIATLIDILEILGTNLKEFFNEMDNERVCFTKEDMFETEDEELNDFLFSLGCYSGEPITVISHLKGGLIVSIKDGRYNIDNELARAIII